MPTLLSLLLSLIHSQIVATSATSNLITADKHNKCQFQQHRKRRERERKKRRKSTRSRSALNGSASDGNPKSRINNNSGGEIGGDGDDGNGVGGGSGETFEANAHQPNPYRRLSGPQAQQQQSNEPSNAPTQPSSLASAATLRKRNVNWRSPIKSNHYTVSTMMVDVQEINGEITTTTTTTPPPPPHAADDDGFESLNSNENGKSSSGEEMTTASKNNSNNSNEIESTARNSASFSMGTDNANFGDDDDADVDDNDLINGTNDLSENVSKKKNKQLTKIQSIDERSIC